MSKIDDALNGSAERLQSEVKKVMLFMFILLLVFFSLPIIIINWEYGKWSETHNEERKQLLREIEGDMPSSHR